MHAIAIIFIPYFADIQDEEIESSRIILRCPCPLLGRKNYSVPSGASRITLCVHASIRRDARMRPCVQTTPVQYFAHLTGVVERHTQFNSIKKLDYTPYVARLFVGVGNAYVREWHTTHERHSRTSRLQSTRRSRVVSMSVTVVAE